MPAAERTWADFGFNNDVLARNLAALKHAQPELAAHLEKAGIHEQMTMAEVGGQLRVHRQFRRQLLQVEEAPGALASAADEVGYPMTGAVFVCGIGTGERLLEILRTAPETKVIGWESDPSLMILALSRHDVTGALAAGTLELCLGAELHATALPPIARVVLHPLLGSLHLWDRLYLEMRLTVQTEESGCPVPEGGTAVAVLQGELLTSECSEEFHRQGFDIFRIDAGALTADQIARELALVKPAFAFSINFFPELGALAGRFGFPYVSWEIDPSASIIPELAPNDRAREAARVYTWRRPRQPLFVEAGYEHVTFMPLACGTTVRRPGVPLPANVAPAALSFIGSCMQRQGIEHRATLERLAESYGADRAAWDRFLSELERLRDAIDGSPCIDDLEARIRTMLSDCGLPATVRLEDGDADMIVLAGEALASTKRIAVVRSLIDLGVVVHGEQDWADALPELDYRGPISHGAPLSAHFGTTAINIDINRIYQPDIVTLRTFEVAACGGFLISEANDEIATLFEPDREIVLYQSIEELREKVSWYLEHADERQRIAEAFHQRFMRDHRLDQKLERMLAELRAS